MITINKSQENEKLHEVVEVFWDTFPPFWHRIRAHIRQVAADEHEISVEQFHILRLIRRGQCTVSELADVRNISRPAVSQAVNILVEKGLIARTTSSQDRRHIQLALTQSGDALLDAIFDSTHQWMVEVLAPLNDKELKSLADGMEVLKKIQLV